MKDPSTNERAPNATGELSRFDDRLGKFRCDRNLVVHNFLWSLLHNYRGSGGRGQPPVRPPGRLSRARRASGASRRAEVWRNVADAGPSGAVRACPAAPCRSGAADGGGVFRR